MILMECGKEGIGLRYFIEERVFPVIDDNVKNKKDLDELNDTYS